MKRYFALAFTLLMLLSLLTACGEHEHSYDNDADYICNECDYNRLEGTWATTIEGEPGEMTLNKDGTGTITSNDLVRTCTWSVQDGKLTVNQDFSGFIKTFLNGVSISFGSDTLTVISQSGNQLVFNKK